MDKALRSPPAFCQYANGACDQSFDAMPSRRGVFLYPSDPPTFAHTIEGAVGILRDKSDTWITWKHFEVQGQVVFCQICKHVRFADLVFADVTTLNFNVLFEMGFAIGLGKPVYPVRDSTYLRDKRDFELLGILDVLGYLDYQNSEKLARAAQERGHIGTGYSASIAVNSQAPLYFVKSPIDTEAQVQMLSAVRQSSIGFRVFDPVETPRLSLSEARKHVGSSLAVVSHLLDSNRDGARVSNARAAFLSGMAVAMGKFVRLIQEHDLQHPIDYRDIVVNYADPDRARRFLEKPLRNIIEALQTERAKRVQRPLKLLERVDLGDVAAENEMRALGEYFVKTAQYQEAKRGNARLVTGRKGSGKTAIFYAVLNAYAASRDNAVLDIKPEGHQFQKLRDAVLSKLSAGSQEYVLSAFWTYIIMCELAHSLVERDSDWAFRDQERRKEYERLVATYEHHVISEAGDFSERLLRRVDKICERFAAKAEVAIANSDMVRQLFTVDIHQIEEAVAKYLRLKESVWILVDNLDKGLPTRGSSDSDILLLRTLLDASRKVQNMLGARGSTVKCIAFVRNDIYEHLIKNTSDRGKDIAIILDYDDPEIFKMIIAERVRASADLTGTFEEIWDALFESHVGTRHSFDYMLSRTLMRPRDFLNITRQAIEVAINRQHDRVTSDDILKAEQSYSEDMLLQLSFEITDVYKRVELPLYGFVSCERVLSKDDVYLRLMDGRFEEADLDSATRLLLWFGFLGVLDASGVERYAYQMRHNLDKLVMLLQGDQAKYVVHPAFHQALSCKT